MGTEGDHRHCKVCGKICGPEQEFCSKSCRAKRETNLATRRNYTYAMYALIAFFVVLLGLSFLHV